MILRQGKGDDDKVGSARVLPQELGLPKYQIYGIAIYCILLQYQIYLKSSACLHCLLVISASASSSSDGMSAPRIWVGIGRVLGQVGLGWARLGWVGKG